MTTTRSISSRSSFDADKPESSSVSVTIQAASVDTGVEMRDHHLKSADFFDADKFPTLTFVSTSVSKGEGDKEYNVVGDLTIHGVTKPVTLQATYLGADSMQMGKDKSMVAKIAGFSATTKIDRRDFGLVWGEDKLSSAGNLMVANDVQINLDITGQDLASLKKMKAMMSKMKKDKPADEPTPAPTASN